MLGIVWGIATVTLLIAYGSSFRSSWCTASTHSARARSSAGRSRPASSRAGSAPARKWFSKRPTWNWSRPTAPLVKHVCLETVHRPGIAYGDRLAGTAAIRGVCPEYGEMRNEVPAEGRWISAGDEWSAGAWSFSATALREQLFSGRPAVGETVLMAGVRFTVIGVMARKIQLSNYFTSDDESVWIPYSAAGDLWNTRYGVGAGV